MGYSDLAPQPQVERLGKLLSACRLETGFLLGRYGHFPGDLSLDTTKASEQGSGQDI